MKKYSATDLVGLCDELNNIDNEKELAEWLRCNPNMLINLVHTVTTNNSMLSVQQMLYAHGIIFQIICLRSNNIPVYAVMCNIKCTWEFDIYNNALKDVIKYSDIKKALSSWGVEPNDTKSIRVRFRRWFGYYFSPIRKLIKLTYIL